MSLRIYQIPAGPLPTNAYLVMDTETAEAILVDTPPDVAEPARKTVEETGARIQSVVITHGHWDHIVGAADVIAMWPVSVIGHELVRERLESARATPMAPIAMKPVHLDQTVDEGDEILVGTHSFRVLHMPGHDVAHITLYSEPDGVMLGGDVLFPDGHGRTDLPGSDQQIMNATLRRFLDLPAETRVLPGHGDETTVGREARWIRTLR